MTAATTTPMITAGLLRAFLTDSVPDETAIVIGRSPVDDGDFDPVMTVAFAMQSDGTFSLVLRTS